MIEIEELEYSLSINGSKHVKSVKVYTELLYKVYLEKRSEGQIPIPS